MALKPVGSGISFATSGVANTSGFISHQSEYIRVIALDKAAHVAVGTDPSATTTDMVVITGEPEVITIGRPSSQRVVAITTGTTTTIDFPEGTGSPFAVGDAVTLTTSGNQSYYDFSHKTIASIDNTAGVGGYFSTRIVVTHNSSGIVTAFAGPYADLRRSFKVSLRTAAGSGKAFVKQVQVS